MPELYPELYISIAMECRLYVYRFRLVVVCKWVLKWFLWQRGVASRFLPPSIAKVFLITCSGKCLLYTCRVVARENYEGSLNVLGECNFRKCEKSLSTPCWIKFFLNYCLICYLRTFYKYFIAKVLDFTNKNYNYR